MLSCTVENHHPDLLKTMVLEKNGRKPSFKEKVMGIRYEGPKKI
jgi:hypothetical protein